MKCGFTYVALLVCLGLVTGCSRREKDHSARYQTASTAPNTTQGTGSLPGAPNVALGGPGSGPTSGTPVSNGMTITSFAPSQGLPGGRELVVINGSFTSAPGVTLAGVPAQVLLRSDSQLIVVSGAGTGRGPVEVRDGSRLARSGPFYSYAAPSKPEDSHFQASTDKWWIDLADADGNGQPDLADAIALARNAQGAVGFNDLDAAVVEMLRAVNTMYRNAPEGEIRTGGAPISFQVTRPAVGNFPPTPGTQAVPDTILDHNRMAIRNVAYLNQSLVTGGTVGLANAENRTNRNLDNDSGEVSGEPLGVYADANVYWWNEAGIPDSRRTLKELMEEIASTVAHEVGHSLGLDHVETAPSGAGNVNVMSATSAVDPDNVYAFDNATFSSLLSWMPGTNRCTHRAAWSARRLLAQSDAVVVATPMQLQNGVLDLQVQQVVAGSTRTGLRQVGGFDSALSLSQPQLAPGSGATLMFLREGPGGLRPDLGEASAIPLAGRDPAEWTALLDDLRALGQLSGAAWRARCGELLVGCLDSGDARIRVDALVDLSTQREVVRALSDAQIARVLQQLRAGDAFERCLTAQVLLHRGDPANGPALLAAALGEDDPAVLADLAGALEMSVGLPQAAAQVRSRLPDLDAAGRARAVTLLGWLLDEQSLGLITDELRSRDPARACRAADALAAIGEDAALPALRAVAGDLTAPAAVRERAREAIARIE